MELYRLGNIFLDISIGIILLGAIVRFTLAITYFKRNGSRVLTEEQRKKMRIAILPISIIGLIFAVAALILLVL